MNDLSRWVLGAPLESDGALLKVSGAVVDPAARRTHEIAINLMSDRATCSTTLIPVWGERVVKAIVCAAEATDSLGPDFFLMTRL